MTERDQAETSGRTPRLLCPECRGRGHRLTPFAAVISVDDTGPHTVTAGVPMACDQCEGTGRLATGPPV